MLGRSFSSSIVVASLSFALLASATSASAAIWADDRGDVPIPEADIDSYELTNSVTGVKYSVDLAIDSFAAETQSFLETEIDLGSDGTVDLIAFAQSPYGVVVVQTPSGRTVCQASATYSGNASSGATISVSIPASCTKYAVRVSAQHKFMVSTDEENGIDFAGSFDDAVKRKVLKPKAVSERKNGKVKVTLKSDPLNANRVVALQVRSKKKWKTVSKTEVSQIGRAKFSVKSGKIRKGTAARIVWGRTVLVPFRLK